MEAFRHLVLPIPEQVIEVPKISSSSRRSRRRRVHLSTHASLWSTVLLRGKQSSRLEQPLAFRLFHARPQCNDRCRGGAELKSLFIRQSTEAFGRILVCLLAQFALGKMEHYFVLALYLTATCLFYVWVLKIFILREILLLFARNAWLDSGYMFCISTWRFWTNCTQFLRRRGLEY